MPLGIKRWSAKGTFRRAYKNLDAPLQQEVNALLEELINDELSHGRKLKPMKGYRNPKIWEVRVTQNYRLTFEVEGEVAVLRNVGTHNVLYANP